MEDKGGRWVAANGFMRPMGCPAATPTPRVCCDTVPVRGRSEDGLGERCTTGCEGVGRKGRASESYSGLLYSGQSTMLADIFHKGGKREYKEGVE